MSPLLVEPTADVDDVQDDGDHVDDSHEGECQRCGAARSLDYHPGAGLYLCDPCLKVVERRQARRAGAIK